MISIVVPVYNVEPYLAQCIESILRQTYKDFELILVDDGSPDRCGAICDEFAEQDSRIRVIHQKNGGVSKARNAGIDESIGEWICFIDADDYIEKHYLENFIINIDEKIDLIYQSKLALRNGKLFYELSLSDEVLDVKELFKKGLHHHTPWGKLFRLSIIKEKGLRFNSSLRRKEDIIFYYSYLCYARLLMTLSYGGYICRLDNPNSATKKARIPKELFLYLMESWRILSHIEHQYKGLFLRSVDDACGIIKQSLFGTRTLGYSTAEYRNLVIDMKDWIKREQALLKKSSWHNRIFLELFFSSPIFIQRRILIPFFFLSKHR